MRLFFKINIVLIFLYTLNTSAFGVNKDIILCLDESGSMQGEKFYQLVYAIQLTASLLDETDRLYIIRGGGVETIEIDLKNKKSEIEAKIKNSILVPNGHTECEVLAPAYRLMKHQPSRAKVIIIFGDGAWGFCGTETHIVQDFEQYKPQIIFFKIETPFEINQSSYLEQNLSGLPLSGFQVYRNPTNDLEKVKENLFKLAKNLIEVESNKVKLNLSSYTIEFTPEFPLKKVLLIIQKEDCKLSKTSLRKGENIEINNIYCGGSQSGIYYEIVKENNHIIEAGKTIKFELSCAIQATDIDIIPIVAMDLVTKIEGNFIELDTITKNYILCEREKEVNIKVSLANHQGQTIDLSKLSGLQVKVTDGTHPQTLNISGNYAVGTFPVSDEIIYLTVEAQYEGYFQKKSKIITLKKQACPLSLEVEIEGDIKNKSRDGKHLEVCQQVTALNIQSIVKDENGSPKPLSDLGTVAISIKTEKNTYSLNNNDTGATGTLPITENPTIIATFLLTIDDKLFFESPVYTIQQVLCRDTVVLDLGEMPMMDFVETGRCIDQVELRVGSEIIHPREYDIQLTGIPKEIKVIITPNEQYFSICFYKSSFWCDCWVKHGIFGGKIIAIPKDSNAFMKVEKDWKFTLLPEHSFFIRCKTCLLFALLLGGLLWYIYGIWIKPRFHQSAYFYYIEEDRSRQYGSPPEEEFWLKSKSFSKRYLIPYVPEQTIIGDDNLIIIASNRKDSVYLSKKSFLEDMRINGSKIEEDIQQHELIGENETIRIKKSNTISGKYTFKI